MDVLCPEIANQDNVELLRTGMRITLDTTGIKRNYLYDQVDSLEEDSEADPEVQ